MLVPNLRNWATGTTVQLIKKRDLNSGGDGGEQSAEQKTRL